jgi:tetraacyldisaccharide-1-P 4'-kinase
MHDFIATHIEQFVQLHPRPEALETPIKDPVKVKPYENANWYNWEIKEVDNNSNP